MKKISILSFLILSLFTELALASAYYVRSNTGSPWGKTSFENDMDIVFGVGGWIAGRYETVDPDSLFSSANNFIYLEGGAASGPPMRDFIAVNKTKMEDWVSTGGTLFINSAPWYISTMDLGFGVTLHYPDYTPTGVAVDPSHPIFNGPFGATGTTFNGNYFGHSTLTGSGLTPLIVNNTNGKIVLAEKTHGRGIVFLGGITASEFHNPKPQVSYLQQNIRSYQTTFLGSSLVYNRRLTMNPGGNANVTIGINNKDTFVVNGVISYSSDTLSVSGPSNATVAAETIEDIVINIGSSPVDEGSHTVEVTIDLDQGETFVAELVVDLVNFEQLTPNTSFNSYSPSVSADGNVIIFTSAADLAGNSKHTSSYDVFTYNKASQQYKQITSNQIAKRCYNPVISGNGKYAAAFCNSSLDHSRPNPDSSYELYYFDLIMNTVKQVNINSNLVTYDEPDQISMNHEGDIVYFTNNINLDPDVGSPGTTEVYLYDHSDGSVKQKSQFYYSNSDIQSLSTDYEGKRFVVSSRSNTLGLNSRARWRIFAGTLSKGVTHQITKNNTTRDSSRAAISGNGEVVVIQSRDNLQSGYSSNNREQIFISDFDGKNFKQITHSSSYNSYGPAITNDGNRIVFRSDGSFDGANASSNYEIFMYNVTQNRFREMTDVNAGEGALQPKISADGSTIVFEGHADWITGDNPSKDHQIFFQSNLGVSPVTKYEDPEEQYAQNLFMVTYTDDEEEMKKATGYFSWLLVVGFALLAFRRRKPF